MNGGIALLKKELCGWLDLEKFFYNQVIVPLVDLSKVYPQHKVRWTDGSYRVVDFALISDTCIIVIEIDGYKSHARSQIASYDYNDGLNRHNEMTLLDYKILRFSDDMILNRFHDCIRTMEALINKYPELKKHAISHSSCLGSNISKEILIQAGVTAIDIEVVNTRKACNVGGKLTIKNLEPCEEVPENPYVVKAVLPGIQIDFKGKSFWLIADGYSRIFKEKSIRSPYIGELFNNDYVEVCSVDCHCYPLWCPVKVFRRVDVPGYRGVRRLGPKKGERIYLLYTNGGNSYRAWYKGTLIDVPSMGILGLGEKDQSKKANQYWAEYLGSSKPRWLSWLKVKTSNGVDGWILFTSENAWKTNNNNSIFLNEQDLTHFKTDEEATQHWLISQDLLHRKNNCTDYRLLSQVLSSCGQSKGIMY